MTNRELNHTGIKGMKWGVRRYQNADGTLTNAGKERYGSTSNYKKKRPKELKAKKDLTNAGSNVAREGRTVANSIYKIKDTKNRKTLDLSSMTDAELREKINRMNMEQQYSNLVQQDTSKGREYVDSTLTLLGSTLAITSSALSIALAVHQLKNS